MLKREHNDLLTQTDPGTPMGRMFRCYWLPAMLASELPEDGCPPVRLKLLGERLLAIRDGQGRYGLIDEFCPHRRASLWFGKVEDGVMSFRKASPAAKPVQPEITRSVEVADA